MATVFFAIGVYIFLAILLGVVILIMPKEKMKIIRGCINDWKEKDRSLHN